MKKLLSAVVCTALLLSFTLSVSAAGPCIPITDWRSAVLDIVPKADPNATPAPVGNPTPTPVADTNIVQCEDYDFGGDSADFTFTVVDFDGGKGVQIKNGANVNSGQAIFTISPNRTDLTDLSDVDTIRIRIKTDCAQDSFGLWFTNRSLHSAVPYSTVLYDLDHNERESDTFVWSIIPVMPAGFDGYIVIDLNTTVNFGDGARRTGVTFADIQSDFIDTSLGETWRFQFMDQTLDSTDATGGMLPGESITVGNIDLVSGDDLWAGLGSPAATTAALSTAAPSAAGTFASSAPLNTAAVSGSAATAAASGAAASDYESAASYIPGSAAHT